MKARGWEVEEAALAPLHAPLEPEQTSGPTPSLSLPSNTHTHTHTVNNLLIFYKVKAFEMQTLNLFAACKVKLFLFMGCLYCFPKCHRGAAVGRPPRPLTHSDCAVTHDQTQTDDRSLQTSPNTVPSPNTGRRRR